MVFTSHDRPGQQDLNGLDLQLEGFSAAPKASTRHSGELLLGRIYTQRRGAKEREKQGSLAVPRLYRLECYRDAMERRAEGVTDRSAPVDTRRSGSTATSVAFRLMRAASLYVAPGDA